MTKFTFATLLLFTVLAAVLAREITYQKPKPCALEFCEY